ncbi:hypothetical protein N0V93_010322 [Gnomoniopsis smithogilvyi]|uniref:Uncharacterized protein n=1 Tax=Gnomoniopsis smithogilvyi TaxID=1191159 RepID=A0A9W9CSM6_9PEZI|nr:hypothetical protein N0V93_010322 [Gnomoniopsis smithogilvyi]
MTPPPSLQQLQQQEANELQKKNHNQSQPPKSMKASTLSPFKNIQATPKRRTLAERAGEFPVTPTRSSQATLPHNSPNLVSLNGKARAVGSRAEGSGFAMSNSPTKVAPKFKTLVERAGEFHTIPASPVPAPQTTRSSYSPSLTKQDTTSNASSASSKVAGSPMPPRKTLVERAGEYPSDPVRPETKNKIKGESLVALYAKRRAEQQKLVTKPGREPNGDTKSLQQ